MLTRVPTYYDNMLFRMPTIMHNTLCKCMYYDGDFHAYYSDRLHIIMPTTILMCMMIYSYSYASYIAYYFLFYAYDYDYYADSDSDHYAYLCDHMFFMLPTCMSLFMLLCI